MSIRGIPVFYDEDSDEWSVGKPRHASRQTDDEGNAVWYPTAELYPHHHDTVIIAVRKKFGEQVDS